LTSADRYAIIENYSKMEEENTPEDAHSFGNLRTDFLFFVSKIPAFRTGAPTKRQGKNDKER